MARYTVVFGREALGDLAAIRSHIENARDLAFANAFVERIVRYCEGFGDLPHRGTLREEYRPGLRTVGWRRTVTIAFRVTETSKQVLIVGVFYRGRDVAAALKERR